MTSEVFLACPQCNQPVQLGDEFCEACGNRLAESPPSDARDHAEIDLGAVAGITDVGLVHARNEDALYLAVEDSGMAIVVCDGISNSAVPHLAASAAAHTAGHVLSNALKLRQSAGAASWDPKTMLETAITEAQGAVVRVPWPRRSGLPAPSCTFVSALWDGETVTVGWVGDSRAYWMGSQSSRQLTADHAGMQPHQVTRWLGADAPDHPLESASFRPSEAGKLVVCSAGLWAYAASVDELAALLVEHTSVEPPMGIARALLRHAIASGGHDNITVAVAHIAPRPGLPSKRR